MPDIIKYINIFDVIFVILLIGMIYKGLRTGVGGQIISLVGYIIIIFVSVGYYSFLSEAIFGFMLQNWAKPISFFSIGIALFVIVKLLERILNVFTAEELASIERMGGVIVAAVRACLLYGIICILFLLMPVDVVRDAIMNKSRTAMMFVKLDASIYSGLSNFISKENKETPDKILNRFIQTDVQDNKT